MNQPQTLRMLAKAYATGTMEKDVYRKERADYLEGAIAGHISIPEFPLTPPRASEITLQKEDGNWTRELPPEFETDKPAGNPYLKPGLFAGTAVLVVIILIAVFSSGDPEPATPVTGTSAPAMTVAETSASNGPARTLIQEFLASNNWADGTLDAFVLEWQSLPQAERLDVQNAVEYGQMVGAIYKKLLEERALARIGNPETALEKQRVLVEFANRLGITDPRIRLPDESGISVP